MQRYQSSLHVSTTPAPASDSSNFIRHIEDFMLKDSLSFTPTPGELRDLIDGIFKLISTTAATLLDTTDTKYNQRPDTWRFVPSVSLIKLCGLIYMVDDVKALLKEHLEAQVKAHTTLQTILRAVIAVAVNEWVFKGQHMSLPPALSDKSPLMSWYEQTVAVGQSTRPRAVGY